MNVRLKLNNHNYDLMGFDTIEINLVIPHILVWQLSLRQKWTILEDD